MEFNCGKLFELKTIIDGDGNSECGDEIFLRMWQTMKLWTLTFWIITRDAILLVIFVGGIINGKIYFTCNGHKLQIEILKNLNTIMLTFWIMFYFGLCLIYGLCLS